MRVLKARPTDFNAWGLAAAYDGIVPLLRHLCGGPYSSLALTPGDDDLLAGTTRGFVPPPVLPFTVLGVPGWVWWLPPPHSVRCWDQLGRPGPRSTPP